MIAGRELIVLSVRGPRAVAVARHAQTARPRRCTPRFARAAREFARLAESHPEAWLAWCDARLERVVPPWSRWPGWVRHPLEILHVGCLEGMPRRIAAFGLVDFSSPCLVRGPTDRRFPTWAGGARAGIGRASTFLAAGFDPRLAEFELALLDVLFRAQAHGACCYSEPRLLGGDSPGLAPSPPLPEDRIAQLVFRTRGAKWLAFWLAAHALRGGRVPWTAALRALRGPRAPRVADTPWRRLHAEIAGRVRREEIDVVLPTLGRPREAIQVLRDLARQTLAPRRVVVVEQGASDTGALGRFLAAVALPFEALHLRVPWKGAGRARNLALERTASPWVLLVDDDVRLRDTLLEYLLGVAQGYRVEAVTGAVHLPGQQAERVAGAPWPRPWGSFAGGLTLVARAALRSGVRFDERLDAGYGEDVDFGLCLREAGANVLYAPACPSVHLKAAAGGFRQERALPWNDEPIAPRPSPTVLLSRRKHHSAEMLAGYRLYYTLGRLRGAAPGGLWRRWRRIDREWRCADRWAARLEAMR